MGSERPWSERRLVVVPPVYVPEDIPGIDAMLAPQRTAEREPLVPVSEVVERRTDSWVYAFLAGFIAGWIALGIAVVLVSVVQRGRAQVEASP